MTKEQFDREKKYQAALAVAREMLQKGIINEADFLRIEARLRQNSGLFWAVFSAEKPFFSGWLPITSVS